MPDGGGVGSLHAQSGSLDGPVVEPALFIQGRHFDVRPVLLPRDHTVIQVECDERLGPSRGRGHNQIAVDDRRSRHGFGEADPPEVFAGEHVERLDIAAQCGRDDHAVHQEG